MQNTTEIPVFFTIDDSYAPLLAVAMKSLMENADKNRRYKLLIIEQDVSQENKDKLASMAREPFSVEFFKMEKTLDQLTDRAENRLRCDYFALSIFYRIFLPDMFPQYDKAIYIDSDIVVPGDISKMYDIDLDGKLIGACIDLAVAASKELSHYVEQAVGVDNQHYVNSGVLLLDMKALREKNFAERFLYLLDTYHPDCLAPDQDYFNAMCYGQVHFLDNRWDVMPSHDGTEVADPWLIHYNLFDKPWCYEGIQYADYFWHYADMTEYSKYLHDFLINYPEEQKQSDTNSMGLMIQKAMTVPEQDITFRKLLERGENVRL